MGPYLCSATEIGTHAITHYNSLWPKSEFADEGGFIYRKGMDMYRIVIGNETGVRV